MRGRGQETMLEEEGRSIVLEKESPEGEAVKKTYKKAELTIHGDLKEITGLDAS
jgi:hypothetical protein